MDPLGWAAVLLLIGLALAVLEVFVPSGGIIGFLSILAALAAIVLAFRQGYGYGLGFLGAAVVALPAALALALHWWPATPMGRRILLPVPTPDEVLPDDERLNLKSLVGQVGQARSLMLPSGLVAIQGHHVDAVSEGMVIEAGQWVRVIEVRGTRVVVRPTDPQTLPSDPKDPLSQPIDTLGLNPFEDPLA
ncbi:MAG: NfeD family protein [Pirellulales bacterium]